MSEHLFQQMISYCRREGISLSGKKWVIACSGGADSTALCHLAVSAGIRFSIAHVNYHLRGEESMQDEAFLRLLAEELGVSIDVLAAPLEADIPNLQEEARKIRYAYLEKIRKESGSDYVATAHHADDQAETVLLQLIRGSGLNGLAGIRPKRNRIIRPLLFARSSQIKNYLGENRFNWREDSSNKEKEYLRNQLRHDILPRLELLRAGSTDAIARAAENIRGFLPLWEQKAGKMEQKLEYVEPGVIHIPIRLFLADSLFGEYVRQKLIIAGFTRSQLADIQLAALHPQGQSFAHHEQRICVLKTRIIWHTKSVAKSLPQLWPSDRKEIFFNARMVFTREICTLNEWPQETEKDRLYLPNSFANSTFMLRHAAPGDYFYPSGMNRKKKKVSAFLKDAGVIEEERKQAVVLVSGDTLLWVCGYRPDDRIRISSNQFPGTFLCIHKEIR